MEFEVGDCFFVGVDVGGGCCVGLVDVVIIGDVCGGVDLVE